MIYEINDFMNLIHSTVRVDRIMGNKLLSNEISFWIMRYETFAVTGIDSIVGPTCAHLHYDIKNRTYYIKNDSNITIQTLFVNTNLNLERCLALYYVSDNKQEIVDKYNELVLKHYQRLIKERDNVEKKIAKVENRFYETDITIETLKGNTGGN